MTVFDGPDGERAAVSVVAGHRIVTRDTADGRVSRARLDWRPGVLTRLCIVAFHHPRIAVPGVHAQETMNLVNRVDLTAAPDTVRYVPGSSARVVDTDGPVMHTLHVGY